MAPEDPDDTEPPGSAPSERIWLHPSEIGSLLPPAPPSRPLPGPSRRRSLVAMSVPVLSGMCGAALVVAVLVLVDGFARPAGPARVVERVADLGEYDLRDPEGVASVVASVAPAIVGLRTTTPTGERIGSGVVFRSDGHVLTSHQLIDGATSIELTRADGSSWVARRVGSDPESDVGVLAVAGGRMEPAVLGSAQVLRVGQTAVVIGAPSGPQGSPSVTAGVIAGLGEVVEVAGKPLYDVIATDALIAVRAAGGPLVDRRGAVVGIATRAGLDGGRDRLGLVVPIDLARRVADQIIAGGRVAYPWLGLTGTDLDPWTAREYGVNQGTLIRKVNPESPAAEAGVSVQDVVTAVEQAPISTMNELMMLVRRHDPGDRISLTVVRSGAARTVKVKLGAAPPSSPG